MKKNSSVLGHLLSPLSVSDYLTKYYGKQSLHLYRNDREFYKALFDVDAFDAILSNNLLTDIDLRISKVDSKPDRNLYTAKDILNNESYIDVGKLLDLVNEGYSAVLDNIAKFSRKILDLEIEISRIFGYVENISTNLYLTPPDSQAFPMHYDTQEIFILQVAGTKTWEIYEETKELYPIDFSFDSHLKEYNKKSSESITLMPGDFLYLPRGAAHQVYTGAETSLHLTVSIFPYTNDFVLKEFLKNLIKGSAILRKNVVEQDLDINTLCNILEKKESISLLENVKANLKYKNKYIKLQTYKGAIKCFFDDVNLEEVKVRFREGVKIIADGQSTLICYGNRETELQDDFFFLSEFADNNEPFTAQNLSPFSNNEIAPELIYVLLKDGFVYKI